MVRGHSSNSMPFMVTISLECIFTGDETQVHRHSAETNMQAWNGKMPGPRDQKKIKMGKSAEKAMATVF
jgi:hypothetical protein